MTAKDLGLYTVSVICLTDPTASFEQVKQIGTTMLSRLGWSEAEQASFFLWVGYGYAAFQDGVAALPLHGVLLTQRQK